MESLLLENLAKTQAFDAALRKQGQFDRIATRFAGAIMFQQDEGARAAQVEKLQAEVVAYFDRQVQPEARRMGIAAARDVLAKLKDAGAAEPDLNDPLLRRRVLVDDKLRPAERLRIFQAIVADKGNTLHNRLTAYWLEPGTAPQQKLAFLRNLHDDMERRRLAYDRQLLDFYAGRTDKRPPAPQLDYMSRFTREVKMGALEQARRAGTEAETAHFVSQGHKMLAWVTVNASEACKDCRGRQGTIGDIAFWEKAGRPGSGKTVCGTRCFCMLVPAKTLTAFPKLQEGLDAPVPDASASAATDADKAALAKALEESKAKLKDPPPFPEKPEDLARLREVKRLGGSTGAMLVEDEFGQRFVMKRGANAGHLREEFHAENAYRALGFDVPDSRLYEGAAGGGGQPVKLAKFIDGKTLDQLTGKAKEAAEAKLREGFGADAILGDWDVVGMGRDNVLVGTDGRVWRIDVGGSLRYRAQGALKTDAQWNGYPSDLFTLRDPRVNAQTAAVFGPLKHAEVLAQVEAVAAKREALLASLPEELRATVGRRVDEAARLARTGRTLLADRYEDAYVAEFNRHQLGLRAAGIVDKLPKKLTQGAGGSVTVYDEDGKAWDSLRGEGNLHAQVYDYIDRVGGDHGAIVQWASSQAGSSWSEESKAFKAFAVEARGGAKDGGAGYYWRGGFEDSQRRLAVERRRYGAEKYDRALTAYHAYNYEFLQRVEFATNDRAAGELLLVRTENKDVMDLHKAKRGDKGVVITRGAAESFSAFKPIVVCGSEQTVTRVPHHRVFGSYFHQRDAKRGSRGSTSGMFLGDSENEVVAMGEGLRSDYVRFEDALKAFKPAAKPLDDVPPPSPTHPYAAASTVPTAPTSSYPASWAGYQQYKAEKSWGGTFKQYMKKMGYPV